jgi:hypothetical protein
LTKRLRQALLKHQSEFSETFPLIPKWLTDLAKVGAMAVLSLLKMQPGELDFLIGGPPLSGLLIKWQALVGRQPKQADGSLYRACAADQTEVCGD